MGLLKYPDIDRTSSSWVDCRVSAPKQIPSTLRVKDGLAPVWIVMGNFSWLHGSRVTHWPLNV